jgi:putative transposase
MPRQARLDSPGTLHHVIIRGINKRRIVDDEQDRNDFVRRLGSLAVETETAIYAWALMSNHAHLLVCSGRLGLAKFMRRLLTGYAASYNLDCAALLRICLALGFSRAHLISDPAGIP